MDGRRDRYRSTGGLYDWYATLALRGIWNDINEMFRFIDDNQLSFGRQIIGRFGYFNAFFFGERKRNYSDHYLLTMAPCPLRQGWDSRITRLSDKLFLALADASYFQSNPHIAELVPSLFASLLTSPDMRNLAAGVAADLEFEDRLRDCMGWLSRELPSVELPTLAQMLLQKYIWTMLDESAEP